jgi:ABC-type multidrug transport system fused ATPase/permease subunit
VRRIVGVSSQEAHIFATTLPEDLRLVRPGATDAQFTDALRHARLLDWVTRLPAGLDTLVGDRGTQLSGRQLQRLSLAHLPLADRPVTITADESRIVAGTPN